ncbi:MAG: GntR family transcriptional regulator [Spirochaetia bacterium]
MEFRDNQAIYMQIADLMCERILSGAWRPGERIPSIRETAETSQVNPNTVIRTYGFLEEKGIIRNQRGVGFFLSDDAVEITRRLKRESFERRDLPRMFRIMDLLSIRIDDLQGIYDAHRDASGKEKAL